MSALPFFHACICLCLCLSLPIYLSLDLSSTPSLLNASFLRPLVLHPFASLHLQPGQTKAMFTNNRKRAREDDGEEIQQFRQECKVNTHPLLDFDAHSLINSLPRNLACSPSAFLPPPSTRNSSPREHAPDQFFRPSHQTPPTPTCHPPRRSTASLSLHETIKPSMLQTTTGTTLQTSTSTST